MEFCPTCTTMLQYELPSMGHPTRFYCPACPCVCNIDNRIKIKRKQRLVRKEIERIISYDDMQNAPTTDGVTCPKCNHDKAAYKEIQTRSADEPATLFYGCLNSQSVKGVILETNHILGQVKEWADLGEQVELAQAAQTKEGSRPNTSLDDITADRNPGRNGEASYHPREVRKWAKPR